MAPGRHVRSSTIWGALSLLVGLMIASGLLDERFRSLPGILYFAVPAACFLAGGIIAISGAADVRIVCSDQGFERRRRLLPPPPVRWEEIRTVARNVLPRTERDVYGIDVPPREAPAHPRDTTHFRSSRSCSG